MEDIERIYNSYSEVAQKWIVELDKYSMHELNTKPSEDSWSLGQVYIHISQVNNHFFIPKIKKCLNRNTYHNKRKSLLGFVTYHILGKFPPFKVKVPTNDESKEPSFPKSKDELFEELQKTSEMMNKLKYEIPKSNYKGKSYHPFCAYLNAKEWYEMVAYHMNHHLKQKKRIDSFLKKRQKQKSKISV